MKTPLLSKCPKCGCSETMCNRCGFIYRKLSPREQELEDLIVGGMHVQKDIAQAMGISPSTVNAHMLNLCRKRGVNGIWELLFRVCTIKKKSEETIYNEVHEPIQIKRAS